MHPLPRRVRRHDGPRPRCALRIRRQRRRLEPRRGVRRPPPRRPLRAPSPHRPVRGAGGGPRRDRRLGPAHRTHARLRSRRASRALRHRSERRARKREVGHRDRGAALVRAPTRRDDLTRRPLGPARPQPARRAPPARRRPRHPATTWLSTVNADGRLHAVAVGALLVEGAWWFTSGRGTRKSRDLATNPRCSVSTATAGMDITVEGRAERITDLEDLRRLAGVYASQGWPATATDDGDRRRPHRRVQRPQRRPPAVFPVPPRARVAFALGTSEPFGATKWRF
ncbi:MAG: pyridoxamine 5'-phosphate oxidase family protein [Acidimicrobiales bacterium]